MPFMSALALVRVGFCTSEVKPFGPLHANVAFVVSVSAVSCSSSPAHGVLAVAVAFTVLPAVFTVIDAVLTQPFSFLTVMVKSAAFSPLKVVADEKLLPSIE